MVPVYPLPHLLFRVILTVPPILISAVARSTLSESLRRKRVIEPAVAPGAGQTIAELPVTVLWPAEQDPVVRTAIATSSDCQARLVGQLPPEHTVARTC